MAGETIGLTIGRKDFVAETNAWSEAQIAAAERLPVGKEPMGTAFVFTPTNCFGVCTTR